jgi:hypothetical protein
MSIPKEMYDSSVEEVESVNKEYPEIYIMADRIYEVLL